MGLAPKRRRLGVVVSSVAKMGQKNPNLGTFEVCFPRKPQTLDLLTPPVGSTIFHWPKWVQKPQIRALLRCVFPPNTASWVSHLSLAKMGQKTPKLGTFGVCFPPKPHTLDLPTPPVGSTIFHWPKWVKKTQIWGLLRGVFPPNTTTWVYFLPIGQNGSKNPKFRHFWGIFSPQITTSWVSLLPVGQKWVQKPQIWALLGCVFPPNPKHWISQHNRLALPSFIGQNGSKKTQNWVLLRCVFPPNTTSWVSLLPVGQNGSKNPKIGHF